MKMTLRTRLLYALVSLGLLLFTMAYYWQGNLAHEIVGTLFLVMIVVHNILNRRWYGAISKRGFEPRHVWFLIVVGGMVVLMSVLFATSPMISRTLFTEFPVRGDFTIRQLHAASGYWALLIVGLHLGTRWKMIMGFVANGFAISKPNPIRSSILRILAAVLIVIGVRSFGELGVTAKLMMQPSLDFWDFSRGATLFFIHLVLCVVTLVAASHYGMTLMNWWGRRLKTSRP